MEFIEASKMFSKYVQNTMILFAIAYLLLGCSYNDTLDPADPYEKFNRYMFSINQKLEKVIIRPASYIYSHIPTPLRKGLSNMSLNLTEPLIFTNAGLQMNFRQMFSSILRFGINTTLGLGGLIDVSSRMGIEYQKNNFAMTLAHYNVKDGHYLFLPIIGPTTFRDLTGKSMSSYFTYNSPYPFNIDPSVVSGLKLTYNLNSYGENRQLLYNIENTSLDYYTTIKSTYLQKRTKEQEVSIDDLPDIDTEDEWEYEK